MNEKPILGPAADPAIGNAGELPGLYIHIPFCLSKCNYYGFYSITDLTRIPAFRSALRREMDLYRGWALSFDTLYLGGGTPSVLPAADLEEVIADIRAAFAIRRRLHQRSGIGTVARRIKGIFKR